ncbi:MAG TPA: twin-arginine translocase subunit TatC, partial [Pirellulales bacterium]
MAARTPSPPTGDNFENDPFQHTTMSFGEHLDELRSSLFKAVFCLALGFGVGMLFGTSIVNMIQRPLVGALTNHRETEALERFQEELQARASDGDE